MKIAYIFVITTALIASSGGMSTNKPLWHQLENYEFEQYVLDFEKEHNSIDHPEYFYRKMIFENNLRKIRAHNADETQSWKMGVNQFSDLTQAEFKRHLGYANGLSSYRQHPVETTLKALKDSSNYKIGVEDLPVNFDW